MSLRAAFRILEIWRKPLKFSLSVPPQISAISPAPGTRSTQVPWQDSVSQCNHQTLMPSILPKPRYPCLSRRLVGDERVGSTDRSGIACTTETPPVRRRSSIFYPLTTDQQAPRASRAEAICGNSSQATAMSTPRRGPLALDRCDPDRPKDITTVCARPPYPASPGDASVNDAVRTAGAMCRHLMIPPGWNRDARSSPLCDACGA